MFYQNGQSSFHICCIKGYSYLLFVEIIQKYKLLNGQVRVWHINWSFFQHLDVSWPCLPIDVYSMESNMKHYCTIYLNLTMYVSKQQSLFFSLIFSVLEWLSTYSLCCTIFQQPISYRSFNILSRYFIWCTHTKGWLSNTYRMCWMSFENVWSCQSSSDDSISLFTPWSRCEYSRRGIWCCYPSLLPPSLIVVFLSTDEQDFINNGNKWIIIKYYRCNDKERCQSIYCRQGKHTELYAHL